MKKIRLETKLPYDRTSNLTINKKYSMRLPNGSRVLFNSKRDADKFVNLTNKFLTYKLYEWNEIYIELVKEYRKIWPYMRHDKKYGRSLQFDEREIKQSISIVETHLDKLTDNYLNNEFGLRSFGICADSGKNALRMIKNVYKKRSSAYDLYTIEMLLQRIDKIRYDLDNWSVDKKVIHSVHSEPINFAKLEVV